MKLNYIKLYWDPETKWDNRCVALMQELFNFRYGNSLVITHPNAVFKTKLITKEKKDIDEINWKEVKTAEETRNTNYDKYEVKIRGDYSGFSYIHKRFREELFVDGNYKKRLKTEHPRFLVVYETSNMRVRAIFKGTKDTFEVAFNPEFVKKCFGSY